jgi:signal transduction histidine kinase
MQTPLGLPLAPGGGKRMGWPGPVLSNMNERQTITVDLGKAASLDEIRLVPAWRNSMEWKPNYGFPSRFKVEISMSADFKESTMVHDNTRVTASSPGQNLQVFHPKGTLGRYVRVTATRMRDRSGDFVFALGELQIYSHGVNLAEGAAVIASNDSFENEEWSPAGLTDGVSKGGVLLELPAWFRLLEQRRVLERKRDHLRKRRSEAVASTQHFMVAASVGGAGVISLVAGLFVWRSHRQRLLDRERHRERLARDLHDELGSNLGSIALLSSLAKHEDGVQLQVDLAHIEKVARESAESMRDLVNLLGDRRGDSTADWLGVMHRLAHGMMREVALECQLPTARLSWEPTPETKREIYLFCKEVLHNALRHGKPTQVKFHLSPTRKGIRIEISDDGRGFSPSANGKGNGLRNLRDRAAIMRGEMTLNSSPDTGTRVILAVPRGRRWNKC